MAESRRVVRINSTDSFLSASNSSLASYGATYDGGGDKDSLNSGFHQPVSGRLSTVRAPFCHMLKRLCLSPPCLWAAVIFNTVMMVLNTVLIIVDVLYLTESRADDLL